MAKRVAGVDESVPDQFARQGFCVLRQVVSHDAIQTLMGEYLSILNTETGWNVVDAWGGDLIGRFRADLAAESWIYDEVRRAPSLRSER